MNRRDFLAVTALALPAQSAFSKPDGSASQAPKWREFEIRTHVEVLKPAGATRVWLPESLIISAPYQRSLSNTIKCEGGTAKVVKSPTEALGIIAAEFPSGTKPVVTVTTRIATRDWMVNLSAPAQRAKTRSTELKTYLRGTKLAPTDGIVKEKATQITANAKTDVEKARAIYEWIVENTSRNPNTRGCGLGNIRFMLESGDLSGKCADINALFVGLARAAGLPARDVYGIRVAASQLGYKSLGASSEKISKAQHCRAEVYLADYGWTPVDPADVRKVMLEEPPGHRPLDDDMVRKARARLFGSWEMNWMAYNCANDVALPGSSGPPLTFFMYPQAETADGRIDSLDPDSFQYEITSSELVAARKRSGVSG